MQIIFELHEKITGGLQNRISSFFASKKTKVLFIRPGDTDALKDKKGYIVSTGLKIDSHLIRRHIRHSIILFQRDQKREQKITERGDCLHRLFHGLPGRRHYSMEQVCQEILKASKKVRTHAVLPEKVSVQVVGSLPDKFMEIIKNNNTIVNTGGEFKFYIEPEKGLVTGDNAVVLSNNEKFLEINAGTIKLVTFSPFIYDKFSDKFPCLFTKAFLSDKYKYQPAEKKNIYSKEWGLNVDAPEKNFEGIDYIATSNFVEALEFAYCEFPVITPKHEHFAPISSLQQDPWDYNSFLKRKVLSKTWRKRRCEHVKEEYNQQASLILWEAVVQSLFCRV